MTLQVLALDDPKDGFGMSHLACLPVSCLCQPAPLRHVDGFPSSDYYGSSATMGLTPVRPSRAFPTLNGTSATIGGPFVSLNGAIPHRPSTRGSEPPPTWSCWGGGAAMSVVAAGDGLHRWELGFKQSSLHDIARVLRSDALHAFRHPPLHRHALVPFGFLPQVRVCLHHARATREALPRVITMKMGTVAPLFRRGGFQTRLRPCPGTAALFSSSYVAFTRP